MSSRTALDKSSTTFRVAGFERLLLVIFAACTLLMPLLYLQTNYFIVAAVSLALSVLAISEYRQSAAYSRVRKVVVAHPGVSIFIAALVTRLLCVAIISPHAQQVSDFLGVYDDSLQRIPTSHSPIWAHYITYPYILHFFVKVFGRATLVGGVFNSVVCSLSILFTYLVGKQCVGKKAGVVASVLMIVWPGTAVYTMIYAPDHLSVLFTLIGIFCFVSLLRAEATKMKILYALACALSLWCMGFFKDITPILVIAFVVTVAILILKNGRSRGALVNVSCVIGLCVLAAFGSVTHIPIISAIAHRPVNPSLDSYFIYTGLGGNNTGSWEPAIMGHYTQLIQQDDYNYKLANHTMLREALSSVKHRAYDLPATLWNKSKDVQANDDAKVSWVQASAVANKSGGLSDLLQTVVEPVNDIFFAGLILLMCAGVYYGWKDRRNSNLTLLVVVCIGYSLLLLIIEAQNRYRYIIEPLYCIFAAYGLLKVYNAFTASKLRKKAR